MKLITFDPGHNTGFATFADGNLADLGTFNLEERVEALTTIFQTLVPGDIVVIESFKLYPWKANVKVWDSFPEVETIGMIKLLCEQNNIETVIQNPSQKNTYDNQLLTIMFDLRDKTKWPTFTKHSLDALRHAMVYYINKYNSGKEHEDAKRIYEKLKTAVLSRQ